jgi:cytochrome c551/c552
MKIPFRSILILLYSSIVVIILLVIVYFLPESPESIKSKETSKHSVKIKLEAAITPEVAEGHKLFKEAGCNSCHSVQEKRVGPALKNVSTRRTKAWIHQFVTNSGKLIEKKDKDALTIYNEFNKTPMPSHEFLSPGDIDKIISYIDSESKNTP